MDSLTAQALTGTEGADGPFWSPDSRFIAYFAQGRLKKIDVSGGPAQTLCDAPGGGVHGTWNREGVIVFAATRPGPLYRVSVEGGQATPVTTLDRSRQENFHEYAQFLPDGRHFLYLGFSAGYFQNDAIYVGSDLGTALMESGHSEDALKIAESVKPADDGAFVAAVQRVRGPGLHTPLRPPTTQLVSRSVATMC